MLRDSCWVRPFRKICCVRLAVWKILRETCSARHFLSETCCIKVLFETCCLWYASWSMLSETCWVRYVVWGSLREKIYVRHVARDIFLWDLLRQSVVWDLLLAIRSVILLEEALLVRYAVTLSMLRERYCVNHVAWKVLRETFFLWDLCQIVETCCLRYAQRSLLRKQFS